MKYKTSNPYIFAGIITVVGGLVIALTMHGLQRDWLAFVCGALALGLANTFKFNDKGILD